MRIAVIGLGLIGGSIGLALRKVSPEMEIIGYSRRKETASLAMELGVVHSVGETLKEAVENAPLVIIATPVWTIKEVFSRIAAHLSPGTVVTDTGSTKSLVMKWAEEILPPGVSFIGGHPMAGKETSGIRAATPELFHNCVYCLTPSGRASSEALAMVTEVVEKLGASPLIIPAERHDFLVAGTSHLPLAVSAALVAATSGDPSWSQMSRLAASGYRDLTRLASGNPEVSSQICLTNQEALISWVNSFIQELERFRQLVAAGEEDTLVRYFARASKARQEWLENRG